MKLLKNKKGGMVLRDVIFLIIIFSGVVALSSIFISNMASTYENTNMTSEYNQDTLGEDTLEGNVSRWSEISRKLDGNMLDLLQGTYLAGKEILRQVILSPAIFSSMIGNVMEDVGVSEELTNIIVFILTGALYILIAFALISAFLRGGKL